MDVDLAPAPFYSLGLEMKIGPLVAIQQGSVASEVGFQVGDELATLNGEPIGDPLTLSQRVGRLAGPGRFPNRDDSIPLQNGAPPG